MHDLAYADIVFDGWKAPSIMQVPGARDVAVEFFTMSKSYNMAGWRIGFMVGNKDLVHALARIKSYHDYGTFTPIQVASIAALEGPQDCVEEIRAKYQKRRDVLVKGLHEAGWMVDDAEGVDVHLGADPGAYRELGSLEFSKQLLADAKVAVSPGIGFGDYGDDHVRFALIENEARIAPGGARHQGDVPQGRLLRLRRTARSDEAASRVGLLGIGTVGGGTLDGPAPQPGRDHSAAPGAPSASRWSPTATLDQRAGRIARRRRRRPSPTIRTVVVREPDIDIVVELIGGTASRASWCCEAIAQRQARRHRQQGAARHARQRDLRRRARRRA